MAKSDKDLNEKKLVSRRDFLAGSGAVLAMVALASCASKTTTTTSNPISTKTSKTSSTTGATTGTLTPKYGGTLRFISGDLANNLGWPADPLVDLATLQHCCDTLLRGDNKGNVIPWLAESYKIADDQKSITFSLRKGIKFHDGSDFNAEVAKWNLDNFITAKIGTADHWDSVEVVDGSTIRVNFTEWQNTLLSTFIEPTFPAFMVSKAAFDKNGLDWMKANPVGTGPFMFGAFNRDTNYKVIKNPDYWVKGKPYLDAINYIFITDHITQRIAMQAGEGDLLGASAKDISSFPSAGFKISPVPLSSVDSLVPDTANADSPWSNQKVREAVEYAIDKEAISRAFGYGYYPAPYQIVPPACNLAYNTNFTLGRKFNVDKSKQLLAEAGFSNGFETTFIVFPAASRDIVTALQANLDTVGIKVTLDFPDFGRWATFMGPPVPGIMPQYIWVLMLLPVLILPQDFNSYLI